MLMEVKSWTMNGSLATLDADARGESCLHPR
jgi:hypothetical protein